MAEFNAKMKAAQEFALKGELHKAQEVYQNILMVDDWRRRHGDVFYELGVCLFQSKEYDEAVQMFIKAYNKAHKKEQVLKLLSDACYLPNIPTFREAYEKNQKALQKAYPELGKISFEDLPLQFVPVSETKFYIFDKRKREFAGAIQIEDCFGDRFLSERRPTLLFKNLYHVKEIEKHISKQQKDSLCLVYDPVEEFLAYCQIVDFTPIIQNANVKMIFNLVDFVKEFAGQGALPKCLVNADKEDIYTRFIEFSQRIIGEKNKELDVSFSCPVIENKSDVRKFLTQLAWRPSQQKILLSIAIPTWNRGQHALDNVKHILKLKCSEEVEIVVSDNGSADEDGKYKELSQIDDVRLKYYKNEINLRVAANILLAIERAQGKFVYLISDEDFVNLEAIPRLLKVLRTAEDVAILHGSVQGPNMQGRLEDYEFAAGYESLLNAAFHFNYFSAGIYNRDLIIAHKLYDKYLDKVDEYVAYPHLYLEALLCTVGKDKILGDILCIEGAEAEFQSEDVAAAEISSVYSFESRLEQHTQFLEMAEDVLTMMGEKNEFKKTDIYLKLCCKTIRLIILVNGPNYQKRRDLCLLTRYAYYYCLKSVAALITDARAKSRLASALKVACERFWLDFHGQYGEINKKGAGLGI